MASDFAGGTVIDEITARGISRDIELAVGAKKYPELAAILKGVESSAREFRIKQQTVQSGDVRLQAAVLGTFSSGKSSFINRLLGRQVCPVDVRPTTSSITRFVYGERIRITTLRKDGGKGKAISQKEYGVRVRHAAVGNGQPRRYSFRYEYPFDHFRWLELVDTPGFGNPKNAFDKRLTLDAIAHARLLFVLMDINRGELTADEVRVLREARRNAPDAQLCLVVAKADTKPAGGRKRILEGVEAKYGDLFHTYVLYSDRDGSACKQEVFDLLERVRADQGRQMWARLRRMASEHRTLCRRALGQARGRLVKILADTQIPGGETKAKIASVRQAADKTRQQIRKLSIGLARHVAESALDVVELPRAQKWYIVTPYARVKVSEQIAARSLAGAMFWDQVRNEIQRLSHALGEDFRVRDIEVRFRAGWTAIRASASAKFLEAFVHEARMHTGILEDEDEATDAMERALSSITNGDARCIAALSSPFLAFVTKAENKILAQLKVKQGEAQTKKRAIQATLRKIEALQRQCVVQGTEESAKPAVKTRRLIRARPGSRRMQASGRKKGLTPRKGRRRN